jgi:hypothetical protein
MRFDIQERINYFSSFSFSMIGIESTFLKKIVPSLKV